jgi:uncharacterized repeat protein (TIGR01451 family)
MMMHKFYQRLFVLLAAFGILTMASPAFAGLAASVTVASGQPLSIYPGQVTQLQLTLSNNNTTAAINNVAFSSTLPGTLPNGLKVAGTPTYSCTGDSGTTAGVGTLTAVVGSQAISLSGGVIPEKFGSTDGSCTIIIPVTAGSSNGAAANYTYTIASGGVTGNDGSAVANTGAVNQSINVLAASPPTIAKSFGNSVLYLGGASTTLTISVSNPNPIPLVNFGITDNFPTLGAGGAIIRVAASPAATSTCTAGGTAPSFTPTAGAVSLTASGGTIAANGSCTITVAVVARQTNGQYDTGALNNTIVGATDFTSDIGLVPANASAEVRARAPLGITKAFANPAIASAQSDSFAITFSNSSTSAITITNFTDSPIDGILGGVAGLTVSGTPTMTCSAGGTAGSFTTTGSNEGVTQTANTVIAAGGTCTLTVPYTGTVQAANTPYSYTNTIAEGAVVTTDPSIVSQSVSASVLVLDTLNISKTVSPANPAPGNPVRYQVTVQNWSTSVLTDLVITDALTNGQTFLTGTIGGINYTPTIAGTGCGAVSTTSALGSSSVVLAISSFPARTTIFSPGQCTISFWAMTSASAVNNSLASNSLPAGSVCYNSGTICNGGASNNTNATINANTLSATKSFTPAGPISEGAVTRMQIRLSNLSANPLTNTAISDTLPTNGLGGQLRVAAVPNAATTCAGTPTITAAANSTSVTMNSAIVPARAGNGTGQAGECFLQVDVTGPAGIYNNTAAVSATETLADGSPRLITPISANASLTINSSLAATKSFSPSAVSSGGTSTVRIRLNNNGAVAINNVSFIDPLPAGMTLANPVNPSTTCAGSTAFSAPAGASSINFTGADIAGNGSCDVLFNVVASGSANWVNTIPVGNITANGNISNQSAVSGTLNYTPPTGVTVSKATNPSTLTFPGQVSRLTITLTNGNTAVTDLALTDYFTIDGTAGAALNGMKIASTPAASTTCTGGTVAAAANGTSVALNGVSMTANSSCTFSVNITSTAVGGITNFIPIGAVTTSQGLTNSGQAATSLTTQTNVGVTKQFTPNVIKPNDRSRLRITFLNPTTQPASNISLIDTMPSGVTIANGPNPFSTCTGAVVTTPTSNQMQVTGGNLAAASGGVAASCYAEIDVVAASEGVYVNTIPIGAVTATVGGVAVSNTQEASDTLRAKSPVVIHKAIDARTLDAGNPAGFTTGTATRGAGLPATLTLSIQNPNSTSLTGVSLTDSLPANLVVAQTPNAGTTCSGGTVNAPASANSITLTGATLAANSTCTVTVDVLSNLSGSYTNTIAANALASFEGVTNEEASSAQIIISKPPTITKQFSPAVMAANGTSTLTIFLGNENSSAATLTSALVDILPTAPGAVVVASTPNVQKTCPGTVTATAGSGTITYANGSVIPANGCSISVDVTASAAGVHTNTIPAGGLQTNLGNNQQAVNASLTVSTQGFISGKVFRDNNLTPNGTFESAVDSVLSGISIQLRSGSSCTGTVLDAQTTDSSGNYLFAQLTAGTYSVCQIAQPPGTLNSITTAGTIVSSAGSTGTAGSASNPTATTSQIVGIVLNADGGGGAVSGSINNNFSELAVSTISGKVFLDYNNNGLFNGSDTGIGSVTIELLDSVGTLLSTQLTDSSGNFSFSGLAPGTYTVRQPNQPANTSNGITTAGSVANGGTSGVATGTTTLPSRIQNIIFPPNTTASGNNFAEIPNDRNITGSVFVDFNNDGIENDNDYGLGGVSLTLTGTDAGGNAITPIIIQTASNGTFTFGNLPEGTYTITQPSQPNATTNGLTTAGSTGGTASNPTATSSTIVGINLTGSNKISAANSFAEVPASAPDLAISKTHAPGSFGEGSATGIFTLTPRNIGSTPTSGVITIVDTLPSGMTIAAPATGAGWSCAGNVGTQTVTCTTTAVIAANSTGSPISLRVAVANGTSGQLLTNTASISGGSEPAALTGNNTATDTVAISTSAQVSGKVWRDLNHNRILDSGEPRLPGWTAELLLNGTTVKTATTDTNGVYSFAGISPSSGYQIRFREPTTNIVFGSAVPNEQGITPTSGTRDTGSATANSGTNAGNPAGATLNGNGTLNDLSLIAGDNIIEQSLPIDPAGVVYDAVTRAPVAGAVVTITGPGGFDPATHLVSGNASLTTGADGFYQFLLTPTAPAGTYTLAISSYPSGYKPLPSTLIPVCSNSIVVNNVPNPALVQSSSSPPTTTAALHNPATCPTTTSGLNASNQATTQYFFQFSINPLAAGNVVNNHIAIDPIATGDIVVTKTSPLVNVHVGQLVPYTIKVQNTTAAAYTNINIRDTMPPGFKYKTGSATVEGLPLEPTVTNRTLTWSGQNLAAKTTRTFKLLLAVGTGVQPGDYVNSAQAFSAAGGTAISNLANATVRVIPDPLFDCSEIIGKVFDDKNTNAYQDDGEPGIPNIRLATVNGQLITTDEHGRYHIACAAIPDADHGSNFVLKLDERTLPTGYRVTTENPGDVRLTRGKMAKLNFGAAIHRVVRVDMRASAFEAGSTKLTPQWQTQLNALPVQLKQQPSVVRLSYVRARNEDDKLARERLTATTAQLRKLWQEKNCCYGLMIEAELVNESQDKSDPAQKGIKP